MKSRLREPIRVIAGLVDITNSAVRSAPGAVARAADEGKQLPQRSLAAGQRAYDEVGNRGDRKLVEFVAERRVRQSMNTVEDRVAVRAGRMAGQAWERKQGRRARRRPKNPGRIARWWARVDGPVVDQDAA